MKSKAIVLPLLTLVGALIGTSSTQAALTLVDEDFTLGSGVGLTWTSTAAGVSNGQKWIWSSPDASTTVTATEVWTGTGGASARAVNTTYDHDQNGGTPNINIPGGFEVMSDPVAAPPDTVRVALQFLLPTNTSTVGTSDGTLRFFAANRVISGLGGNVPLVSLFNVTDNRFILPLTAITYPGGSAAWNFQLSGLDFLTSDLGDTLELRFQETITSGANSGARGLQIADVTLSVEVIPEPGVIALLSLSSLGLMRRRRTA